MENIKIYTIANLKDWILHGKSIEGLSESVITKTRAYSLINNPYVKDNDPVVSALFVNNDLAAYTAAFPERLAKPNCTTHWFNSLYVSPKYEGKGFGLFVVGSLLEKYDNDAIFDLDAVPTSVEILSYLGCCSNTFKQYNLRNKCILRTSIKGHLAYFYEKFRRSCKDNKQVSSLRSKIQSTQYTLCYDNFIDFDTYCFIERHANHDAFLRTQESLNWMLHYPFVHEAPLLNRVHNETLFTSSKRFQRYYVIKIYVENNLAGVYILCNSSTRLSLLYLYYDNKWQNEVLLSIAEHILEINNPQFSTTNSMVAEFIKSNRLYSVFNTTDTSICYPNHSKHICDKNIQGGDGDMFLN